MTLSGYSRMLNVDLAAREITEQATEEYFARTFIGGMGFGGKILWNEVNPEIGPFDDGNILVVAAGPLAGTGAPCSGRTEITTKSALTGIIGSGNTGGMWGARLKHAGYDAIVIRSKSGKPVYLLVDDDKVELKDANHLWGKDTRETTEAICQEMGVTPSQISVMTIGPAGENRVRFASILNDYHHVAARCGGGAVMGDKRLKAIVVRGTGTSKIAQPERFRQAVDVARAKLLAADAATKMPEAPPDSRVIDLQMGSLPVRNYQTGVISPWLERVDKKIAQKYVIGKESVCYACPIPCFNLVEVKEGKYKGTIANRGTMPGVVLDWGAKCCVNNLPAIWNCKATCEKYGMDYASAAGTIAFAMELYQRGIITAKDTDGLELEWGDENAISRLLEKIVFRQGFGDILAEGSSRAAELIGGRAGDYVMTVKGMEMMGPDPRSGSRGWIFGELTNPRGGDNVKNTHCLAERHNPYWPIENYDIFPEMKQEIFCVPPEKMPYTWQGKAMMCKWFEDLYTLVNCLGLCFFPFGFRLAIGPTHLSEIYSACTGWETTPEEVMQLGERVINLFRAYNMREGLSRYDDKWPERFYTEPMPEGPAEGSILSHDKINNLLDEYYQLRGWDMHSGCPTSEKLNELGLELKIPPNSYNHVYRD